MSYPETQNTEYGIAKIHKTGYYRITSRKEGNNGKLLHRLIFEEVHGPIPKGCDIHHIDEDKLNNRIENLELKEHRLHVGHHRKDVPHSDDHKRKLSLAKNTTGYYKVSKVRDDHYKQGFRYVYQYYKDGKRHYIKSVDLNVLEEKVKEKGLVWEGLQ
jgi:hypothetical protein